jgi:hypothetical protein
MLLLLLLEEDVAANATLFVPTTDTASPVAIIADAIASIMFFLFIVQVETTRKLFNTSAVL